MHNISVDGFDYTFDVSDDRIVDVLTSDLNCLRGRREIYLTGICLPSFLQIKSIRMSIGGRIMPESFIHHSSGNGCIWLDFPINLEKLFFHRIDLWINDDHIFKSVRVFARLVESVESVESDVHTSSDGKFSFSYSSGLLIH